MRIKARRAGAALIAVVASVVGFGLTGAVRAADHPPSRIIYVDQLAVGADNGTSWADAYTDLQDALGAAVAGDEIWVAQGIYRPDRGTGDQQATFRLVDGVGLDGGFAGWETNRDQRDVAAHPTVLSGDLLDNDDPGFVPTSDCCGTHAEEGCDNEACLAVVCPLQPGCCNGSYGQWAAICAQYAQSLCCELCGPDRCDNSFHVLTAEGASASVLLDGFTVTAGHARVNQPEFSGGGLLNLAGEATIANCLFRDNMSHGSGAAINNSNGTRVVIADCEFTENRNGAVRVRGDAQVDILRCAFIDNQSSTSAVTLQYGDLLVADSYFEGNGPNSAAQGMSSAISALDPSSATIVGCRFVNQRETAVSFGDEGLIIDSEFVGGGRTALRTHWDTVVVGSRFAYNEAQEDGAAIYMTDLLYLDDCEFEGNKTDGWGGAIDMGGLGSLLIADRCTFRDNSAGISGGAIWNNSLGPMYLTSCLFEGNRMEGTFGGGAISSWDPMHIDRCVFRRNTAKLGGAIEGIFNDASLFIRDSLFAHNSATSSGGAVISGSFSTVQISRSTFAGNVSAAGFGGGLLNSSGDVTINSSVFYDNLDLTGSGESAQVRSCVDGMQIDYSLIDGWTGLFGGMGNSGADPLFVDPAGADHQPGTADDDWRLSAESPAINAGDPIYAPVGDDADLDGHARTLCGRIDMGAYEFGIGDYNCDRIVELDDYVGFPDCLTGPAPADPYPSTCAAYDFATEITEDVDLLDFAGFQNAPFSDG